MRNNHYEEIDWILFSCKEIKKLSNWCGSARGIFRPPYARDYANICNRHDVRYAIWWNIFDKLRADFLLFLEMFLSAFFYFEYFWLWNIFRVFLAFCYFVGVWFFWTIIDYFCFTFLWKNPAFSFWKKKTKKELLA